MIERTYRDMVLPQAKEIDDRVVTVKITTDKMLPEGFFKDLMKLIEKHEK